MNGDAQALHKSPSVICWNCARSVSLLLLSASLGLAASAFAVAAESDTDPPPLIALDEAEAGAQADGTVIALSESNLRVALEGFSLHADCRGSGEVTILFEAGLGGSSLEWSAIQSALAPQARSCVYDRAGYGRSDPSPQTRDARHLAAEADQLLDALGVGGPLILVGHSFGGFIVRLLAMLREADMLAMVLVDASHEDQLHRLETSQGRKMMPSGRHFFVSPASIPDSLPSSVRQRMRLHARQRKTYAALHAEMASFRRSAEQVGAARHLVDYPVLVVRRGVDLYAGESDGAGKTTIWNELQRDLASISRQGRLIVAENSGHHVHADQPQLLIDLLSELLGASGPAAPQDTARSRLP
ncbi:alpha/beta fold hydrolase [Granulosicoccus sp. 3-233]|uniref:alpha/beta fold hydrolase n=1 Tax=Granulosicoccus sp. 3-233 TaxID=3417969 RepID=UPI003D3265EA